MSYYELFQQGPLVYIPTILISLVITVVAYGLFPVLFAKLRKSYITKKQYTWICYGVNFVISIIFAILNGSASFAPYILWTWVFSRYGVKTLGCKGYMPDSDYSEENAGRWTECKHCGYRNKDYFDSCPQCGSYAKQYVDPNQQEDSENN